MARLAMTTAGIIGAGIRIGVRVSSWAVRFCGVAIASGSGAVAPNDIGSAVNGLQVLRVHACAVTAQVIDLFVLRDWADEQLVHRAVSFQPAGFAIDRLSRLSIAVFVYGAGPVPAVGSAVNVIPDTFFQRNTRPADRPACSLRRIGAFAPLWICGLSSVIRELCLCSLHQTRYFNT